MLGLLLQLFVDNFQAFGCELCLGSLFLWPVFLLQCSEQGKWPYASSTAWSLRTIQNVA